MRSFLNDFSLPEANIFKVDTLTQHVFKDDNKFTIINTGMGSGKTAQTISHLKKNNNFIWVTPIIALAQNTHHRITSEGINCCYYKDPTLFKSINDKCKMNAFDNLIICINSLHYLNKTYNIVVIDEIETLLIKWHNNKTFVTKNNDIKSDCWKVFIDIIKGANKVILLDAFTTTLTTNFINSISGNVPYRIYELNDKINRRDVKVLQNYQQLVNGIINESKEGKKLFIFYPYKGKSKFLPSMVDFKMLLTKMTTKMEFFTMLILMMKF